MIYFFELERLRGGFAAGKGAAEILCVTRTSAETAVRHVSAWGKLEMLVYAHRLAVPEPEGVSLPRFHIDELSTCYPQREYGVSAPLQDVRIRRFRTNR